MSWRARKVRQFSSFRELPRRSGSPNNRRSKLFHEGLSRAPGAASIPFHLPYSLHVAEIQSEIKAEVLEGKWAPLPEGAHIIGLPVSPENFLLQLLGRKILGLKNNILAIVLGPIPVQDPSFFFQIRKQSCPGERG